MVHAQAAIGHGSSPTAKTAILNFTEKKYGLLKETA